GKYSILAILATCVYISAVTLPSYATAADQNQEAPQCVSCHGNTNLKAGGGSAEPKGVCIDKSTLANPVHGGKLKCVECHKAITGFPHKPEEIKKIDCLPCHVYDDHKPGEKHHNAGFTEWKTVFHHKNLEKKRGRWITMWVARFFIAAIILTSIMFMFYIVLDVNRWYNAKRFERKNKKTETITPETSEREEAGPDQEMIVDTMRPEKFPEYDKTIPKHLRHKVKFLRWSKNFRCQHILLLTSSITLSITGLAQMFSNFFISEFYFKNLISFPANVIIHKIAASGLIIFCAWHILFIVFTRNGRFEIKHFIPNPDDLYDGIEDWISLFRGRPGNFNFDRYTYLEKFDYFAACWGCTLMIATGSIMWYHEAILPFTPIIAIDIARAIHGFEAILAFIGTMVFHIYMTHFNPRYFPMKRNFLDGMSSYDEMKQYHKKELERIFPKEK
ncbi:MAG TPA: hypothetical protein PKK26_20035, partial [Candidatus Wallbacteria bacterium]|nr:hypothetical protein [Candidatus Wallbacteria bacterium]